MLVSPASILEYSTICGTVVDAVSRARLNAPMTRTTLARPAQAAFPPRPTWLDAERQVPTICQTDTANESAQKRILAVTAALRPPVASNADTTPLKIATNREPRIPFTQYETGSGSSPRQ